jgi:hypothetical protein
MTDTSSPSNAVLAALAAHVAADWPRLAGLLDVESLDAWRRSFVEMNARILTLDEWRARLPKGSEARLAQLAEEFAQPQRRFIANLSEHVPGVHTLEELHALSSAEVFVRVAQTMHPDWMVARLMEQTAIAPGAEVIHATTFGRTFRAVGEKSVGHDRRRVTVECTDPSPSGRRSTRLARRQPDGSWRMMVDSGCLHPPSF